MITFGQYIREARDNKDKSLREFAKELNFSPAFLSDIELGRRFPSEENLKKIAEKLSIKAEELKKYDSRPPAEDMRKLALFNPQYGFAFRAVVDSGVSPEAIIEFTKREGLRKTKAISAGKKK